MRSYLFFLEIFFLCVLSDQAHVCAVFLLATLPPPTMGSGQSGVALTVEKCLGPDQLSLDEIDVLNELPSHVFTTNIVVSGMDEVDIFLSLKYVCKLTEQASTPEHMQHVVESARDFNESNDIRGEICLLNLFKVSPKPEQ